jgi:hypothetical protein
MESKLNNQNQNLFIESRMKYSWDRPILFAHVHKTGGTNFVYKIATFCEMENLNCAAAYTEEDGKPNELFRGHSNMKVLNYSHAADYDIIIGHNVKEDFHLKYLPKNGRYKRFAFFRNPLDTKISLYNHMQDIKVHKTSAVTFDEFVNDDLYPECLPTRSNIYFYPPHVDSPLFKDNYIPLLNEEYENSGRLFFSFLGYDNKTYYKDDTMLNNYENHMENGYKLVKHNISLEVIKRFQKCNKDNYQNYYDAIKVFQHWKNIVFESNENL